MGQWKTIEISFQDSGDCKGFAFILFQSIEFAQFFFQAFGEQEK
jgi:hypothetical protein